MKCKLVNENFKSDYVDSLLMARGIKVPNDYYAPRSEFLQSPTDLENVERGVNVLIGALALDERILIVVDSDNDGFTSATIMYSYLKDLAPDCQIDYILHEGKQHGLQDHIKTLTEDGECYGLIILPDSSSNDYVYHEKLKDLGTSVLVLDHHIQQQNNSVV